MRVPVHQPLAAEDVAVTEHAKEGLAHGSRALVVERERGSLPVARAANLLELAEDARLVLVLPLPDSANQFVAAEVATSLLLFGPDSALHDGLRGDPGVVGPGHPLRVVPLHAPPANQYVLQGVVQGVAHVQ